MAGQPNQTMLRAPGGRTRKTECRFKVSAPSSENRTANSLFPGQDFGARRSNLRNDHVNDQKHSIDNLESSRPCPD